MELKIEKELFQWEKNRFVFIEGENAPIVSSVQFFNKKSSRAIEVDVLGGKARIPNSLLKESLPIVALACKGRLDESQVIARREFKVLKRPMPENYYEDPSSDSKEVIYDGGVET